MSLALNVLYLCFTSNWMAAMLDFANMAALSGSLDLRSLKQYLK